jgi:hypothetical protein
LISDLGSAERKFENIEEESLRILKYILCWFHTFQKCFLPRITNVQNKNLIPYIKKTIRLIYSSKTHEIRKKAIEKLVDIIKEETVFVNYIQTYLEETLLDLWTSLYKISQYSEHTSNYLERLFKKVNEYNLRKSQKLVDFVQSLNQIVYDILIRDRDFGHISPKKKLQMKNIDLVKQYMT